MNGIISTLGWSSARLVYSISAISSVAFSLSSGFLAGYNLDLSRPKATLREAALALAESLKPEPSEPDWYREPPLEIPDSSQPPALFADASTVETRVAPTPLEAIQEETSPDRVQMTFSSALTESEKLRLKDLLLAAQLRSPRRGVNASPARPAGPGRKARVSAENPVLAAKAGSDSSGACTLLPGIRYRRTRADAGPESLCPDSAEWLSKDWSGRGWVLARIPGVRPTLFRSRGEGREPVLLLDELDMAQLAVLSGRPSQDGMGVITGAVPEGFKVRFAGRADEARYFPVDGKRHYAIPNAQPGAGVIEILSEKDPLEAATVFVPVLGNVSTQLDLAAPAVQDVRVKVVKNGAAGDPEVAGLTVSLSTHSGIQAITREDGTAVLKNVRALPGYPLFVDVSSRWGATPSYTWRFELKETDPATGMFLLRQIPADVLDHWLSQVSEGLSPQSALVIGTVDRKKIDGFRFDYRVAVESVASSSGMEPATYTVLWDDRLSTEDPLEGDHPRFLSVQVPEGLGRVQVLNEVDSPLKTDLFPISPRVIHVISP